jgi:hypothetical protein
VGCTNPAVSGKSPICSGIAFAYLTKGSLFDD